MQLMVQRQTAQWMSAVTIVLGIAVTMSVLGFALIGAMFCYATHRKVCGNVFG